MKFPPPEAHKRASTSPPWGRGWPAGLATVFGIGWFPFAPGTVASAAATILGGLLALLGWQAVLMAALVATAIGIYVCGVYARTIGVYDPSECVLDEMAGQWFALVPVAAGRRASDWVLFAVAFFLFRLFDIWKPWPISAAETLSGGIGIMMDDVVAGLFAGALVYAAMATGWL